MSRTFLLGSIGLPGSGKSTFMLRFAAEHRMYYWQNDEARRRIFPDPKHSPEESDILGHCAKYVFSQLLSLGQSCAYDVNLNRHRNRNELSLLAHAHGAEYWSLWFQAPLDVCRQRVHLRRIEADAEHHEYYATYRPDLVEYMIKRLEEPAPGEHVIRIDGTASYEEQLGQLKTSIDTTAPRQ